MQEIDTATLPEFETLIADIPGVIRPLTMTERVVFFMLVNAKGRIVSHSALWDTLYGDKPEKDWADESIIKVYISKVRRKATGWVVTCHHGIGYSIDRRDPNAAPDTLKRDRRFRKA